MVKFPEENVFRGARLRKGVIRKIEVEKAWDVKYSLMPITEIGWRAEGATDCSMTSLS